MLPLLSSSIPSAVESFLGWICCMRLSVCCRALPSPATLDRLRKQLSKAGCVRHPLTTLNFRRHVHILWAHTVQQLLDFKTPPDLDAEPVQKVIARHFTRAHWHIRTGTPVAPEHLQEALLDLCFFRAHGALYRHGEAFVWHRTVSHIYHNDRAMWVEMLVLDYAVAGGFEVSLRSHFPCFVSLR